ncbi:MAG: ribosomal RNA large subunit methyltransferase H [Bacteroidia bacterium]|nr:MAG: ribosomal RNA large subunit methyltransferase H [Bacteroidia bacterium]
MIVSLIVIDKVSSSLLQKLISEYEDRLKHYCRFELITIIMPKNVRYKSIEEQLKEEQAAILKQLKPNDYVVLLDEKGKEMCSIEFSNWLNKSLIRGQRIVFVTGGPYGFSRDIKQQYSEKISLSKMTFSHEMVRLIF